MNSSKELQGDWQHLLTEEERAWMLQDIARVSLAAGRRRFPEHPWADLDVTSGSLLTRKSPIERLAFITEILPSLIQTVRHIQAMPPWETQKTLHRVTPPILARQVEPSALLRAVRRQHVSRYLEETRRQPSWDTPENRAVKAFLDVLQRDAHAIHKIAASAGEEAIADETAQCAQQLKILLHDPWWQGVMLKPASGQHVPTHRMLSDTHYAQVFRWIQRYRQSFQFDWANPLFSLPSRETWRIYEAWCLFQTLDILVSLGYTLCQETLGTTAEIFSVKEDRLMFALIKGHESQIALASPKGSPISLFYNRAYPQKMRSLSRTMQPDIVLEGIHKTWILDPKFKAYEVPGDEGDDIAQMHAYRDAIIDSQGAKPVQRAWCLYAGASSVGCRATIEYGPRGESIVGALCLRPGDTQTTQTLEELLQQWLQETA